MEISIRVKKRIAKGKKNRELKNKIKDKIKKKIEYRDDVYLEEHGNSGRKLIEEMFKSLDSFGLKKQKK